MNEIMPETIGDTVGWLAAESEVSNQEKPAWRDCSGGQKTDAGKFSASDLAGHQFSAAPVAIPEVRQSDRVDEPVSASTEISQDDQAAQAGDRWPAFSQQDCEDHRRRNLYRTRTVAMLRRYMRYSIETGRLPSLLGREFFATRITRYQLTTFEDRVIFVHDMDRCLDRLDDFSREVLARVILQEYEHGEAARLMGCTRMTVHRRLLEALDLLSYILVQVGLLDSISSGEQNSCQGGLEGDFPVSGCDQGK